MIKLPLFMERLRRETINEWFFPSAVRRNGKIYPAPPDALEKYQELRLGWLKNHPSDHEVPCVGIAPIIEPGREGFLVKTEVIYI